MSKHMGARHDDGLGAFRGLMFAVVFWVVLGLFVWIGVWL